MNVYSLKSTNLFLVVNFFLRNCVEVIFGRSVVVVTVGCYSITHNVLRLGEGGVFITNFHMKYTLQIYEKLSNEALNRHFCQTAVIGWASLLNCHFFHLIIQIFEPLFSRFSPMGTTRPTTRTFFSFQYIFA